MKVTFYGTPISDSIVLLKLFFSELFSKSVKGQCFDVENFKNILLVTSKLASILVLREKFFDLPATTTSNKSHLVLIRLLWPKSTCFDPQLTDLWPTPIENLQSGFGYRTWPYKCYIQFFNPSHAILSPPPLISYNQHGSHNNYLEVFQITK